MRITENVTMLEKIYHGMYIVVLVILAFMLFACLIRAVRGPRIADRIVAVNMMGTMVMVMIAVLSLLLKEGFLIDICLIYAMVSFLAVIVISKVYIRLIVGGALVLCGLSIFLIEIYGVFHFDYVLNRMHAAAMGDTLGISFSLVGLMIFSGWNFTTLKMALIVIFLWLASPVSSHLLAKVEFTTNENLERHCKIYARLEELEEESDLAGEDTEGEKV